MSLIFVLDTFSYAVAGLVSLAALVMVVASVLKSTRQLRKANQGAITFRLRGNSKSVTLPVHYSDQAIKELAELLS